MSTTNNQAAHLIASDDYSTLSGRGEWIIGHLKRLESELKSLAKKVANEITLDMSQVRLMDSAGALLIDKFLRLSKRKNKQVKIIGLETRFETLLGIIDSEVDATYQIAHEHHFPNLISVFGWWLAEKFIGFMRFVTFTGEIIEAIFMCIARPQLISWRSVLVVFHNNCSRAMPIIALLNFIFGILIVYQLGHELKEFGLGLLIVNVSSMILLRELTPLITALIASGRTSALFTSQIGSMKIDQEIDALKTMGISPVILLVIPKIIGVLIGFTLLILWADVFAMLGAIITAKMALGINVYTFLERLKEINFERDFILGLAKGPIFAIVITLVGCYQGFLVKNSSDNLGLRTTHSAVQSFLAIIVVNAFAAIAFPWKGF
jgi:phospholipid/cholesterol/gamma-HCH transport system permease protein